MRSRRLRPPASAQLHWSNGETIPGELVEATPTEAVWKSSLFEDALDLRWSALRRIDQPLAALEPADPFGIVLRDGSRIYGDLVSMTGEAVAIRSARHGEAILKRSEVLSIRRRAGGDLLLAGPNGDAGWEAPSTETRRRTVVNGGRMMKVAVAPAKGRSSSKTPLPAIASNVVVNPGGGLLLPYWNRSTSLDLSLPEMVDVEFTVRSTAQPDFQLFLGAGEKQLLRIETWDDELMLTAGDQFKVIRALEPEEREVALRVCWDRKARKCSIFTSQGVLLADWNLPDEAADKPAAEGPVIPGLEPVRRASERQTASSLAWSCATKARIWRSIFSACANGTARRHRSSMRASRALNWRMDGSLKGEVTGASEDSLNVRVRGSETEQSFPRNVGGCGHFFHRSTVTGKAGGHLFLRGWNACHGQHCFHQGRPRRDQYFVYRYAARLGNVGASRIAGSDSRAGWRACAGAAGRAGQAR